MPRAGIGGFARCSRCPNGLHFQYGNPYAQQLKTTLNLNDQRLADAKALAAQQRTSLTRLIEEGLQVRLRAKANPAAPGEVRLPVFNGRGGLAKGVSALSNKALLLALKMTPDVNLLVAASRSDHPHHAVAREWLEDALLASPGVQPVPLGPEWPRLRQICLDKQLGGHDMPDAW